MNYEAVHSRLVKLRSDLETVQELLLDAPSFPHHRQAVADVLAAGVEALSGFEAIRNHGEFSPAESAALRQQLVAIQGLIQRGMLAAIAAEDHSANWLEWLALHTAGYDASGQAATSPVGGQIALEG